MGYHAPRAGRYVRSVALEEGDAGGSTDREWTVRMLAVSKLPLPTDVELRWAVTLDVFGLGGEAPADLEITVEPGNVAL